MKYDLFLCNFRTLIFPVLSLSELCSHVWTSIGYTYSLVLSFFIVLSEVPRYWIFTRFAANIYTSIYSTYIYLFHFSSNMFSLIFTVYLIMFHHFVVLISNFFILYFSLYFLCLIFFTISIPINQSSLFILRVWRVIEYNNGISEKEEVTYFSWILTELRLFCDT